MDYTAQQRRDMAASGAAMPGGRFPIRNRAELENAIRAVGRTQPGTDEARTWFDDTSFVARRIWASSRSFLTPGAPTAP